MMYHLLRQILGLILLITRVNFNIDLVVIWLESRPLVLTVAPAEGERVIILKGIVFRLHDWGLDTFAVVLDTVCVEFTIIIDLWVDWSMLWELHKLLIYALRFYRAGVFFFDSYFNRRHFVFVRRVFEGASDKIFILWNWRQLLLNCLGLQLSHLFIGGLYLRLHNSYYRRTILRRLHILLFVRFSPLKFSRAL